MSNLRSKCHGARIIAYKQSKRRGYVIWECVECRKPCKVEEKARNEKK